MQGRESPLRDVRARVQNFNAVVSPTVGNGGSGEHEKRGESMNTKEKAPTREATRAEAAETAAGQAAISMSSTAGIRYFMQGP